MRTFPLLSLLVGLALSNVSAAEIPLEDSTIIPNVRVGPIEKGMTLFGLKTLFGGGRVKPFDVYVGEGESVPGAKLFGGTDKELQIIFNQEGSEKEITDIRIIGKGWKFDNGLKLGMTVEEVEKINGKPFTINGFGWDYGGYGMFDGGKLEAKVQVRFNFDENKLIPESLLGEITLKSTGKILRKAAPTVNELTIIFPLPEAPEPAPEKEDKPKAK